MDRIDFGILGELQNNARLSNKELAARVKLAPSSCLERTRRLVAEGVLRGFHADVDPAALGVGLQAMIHVRLARHSHDHVEGLERHLEAVPEVIGFYHLTGEFDFLVHVAVRDADHLRNLALDAFTTRNEVAQIQTSLIFSKKRKAVWPCLIPSADGGSGSRP
jgi:DNA-binding Lrp family transcriptional regulator